MKDTKKPNVNRILALDVRPRKFGYAAFETPMRLLDSGLSRFKSTHEAATRLDTLLMVFHPTVVVLRKIANHSPRNRLQTRSIVRVASRQVRRRSVRPIFLSERKIRNHFRNDGQVTKHTIATFIAATFPELACKLPPRRRAWDAEDRRMPIFDAVALGLVYEASLGDTAAARKLEANR
jgi:hypothetical protein